MTNVPHTAMLLAAGLGSRMRPLTDTTAKPLLRLGGKPLMDYALDRLAAIGVERVVVNAHWQADKVAAYLADRTAAGNGPETTLLLEEMLLDTGGSVRTALELLGPDPFYVVNGDAFWMDGPRPALERLAESFDPRREDGILLVHRTFQVHGEAGRGDFALDKWGLARRRREREVVPYIYAGVQLVAAALLADAPPAPFSMNVLWDRAMERGRLRAVVHDGLWFHLSTPPDLIDAEELLNAQETGETR